VTSIGTIDFGSQIWPADEDSALTAAMPVTSAVQASDAGGDRDAQIADLADTSSGVNQLASLAGATSAMPAPTLPTVQQQTQAQQSAAQPPLKLDSYAAGDDGE